MFDLLMFNLGFTRDICGDFTKTLKVDGKDVSIDVMRSPCGEFWGAMVGDSSDIEEVKTVKDVVDLIEEVLRGTYQYETAEEMLKQN